MIDGIALSIEIYDVQSWLNSLPIQFFGLVDSNSAEEKTRTRTDPDIPWIVKTTTTKKGEFEHYKLKLVSSESYNSRTGKTAKRVWLNIFGSLHKNHFGGINTKPFTFLHLLEEISHLCNSLNIDPVRTKIDNLEIGLNLPVWFKPIDFLFSKLLAYKSDPFDRYDPDNHRIRIGYHCEKSDYEIKIYDKSLQHYLPDHLMRFEIKFTVMRKVNAFGIWTLADLTDPSKVFNLLSLLETAWDKVLIFDIEEMPPNLTGSQREFLTLARFTDFWQKDENGHQKPNQKFRSEKKRFLELLEMYGSGVRAIIKELIRQEWYKRFKNLPDCIGWQMPIKCAELPILIYTVKDEIREPLPITQVTQRFCKTCGRDISDQRKDSIFCSETRYGNEGKRCRNLASNPRNNAKKKIEKVYRIGGTLFDDRL